LTATSKTLRPTRIDELSDVIADAVRNGERLAIRGGASKRDIGRSEAQVTALDMTSFSGVIEYDPPELVLTVGAGTLLSEVEALLRSRGQALAFDPFDHGPMFGRQSGKATIGGVIAADVAGPLRLSQGGARDHLLGFEAVSGRAERFVAGGKVVKNVTGYDLPKLMAGSWGRIAALTEVTLKVLPRPRTRLTKRFPGVVIAEALRLMAAAMRSQAEIRAAAHIPGRRGQASVTALLLTGFPASVAARSAMIDERFTGYEQLAPIGDADCSAFWRDMATAAPLDAERPLWRISAPASTAASIGEALALDPADQLFDWAGALIWCAFDGDASRLRGIVEAAGGHAMLVRAPSAMRAAVPTLHPRTTGVAALEERVRRAFDPMGVFETGRF
jgi:glycolate oxidase FAD binding subunit